MGRTYRTTSSDAFDCEDLHTPESPEPPGPGWRLITTTFVPLSWKEYASPDERGRTVPLGRLLWTWESEAA